MNIFEENRNRDSAVPFVPLIVGDDNGVFYYEDEINPKDKALASCCMFYPMPGISQAEVNAIKNTLNTEVPAGSMMQFIQLGTPTIDMILNQYTQSRHQGVLSNLNDQIDHSAIQSAQFAVKNRADFLLRGTRTPLVYGNNTVLTESLCFFTFRVPVKTKNPFNGNDSEDTQFLGEVSEFSKLRDHLISQLEVAGIRMQVMNQADVLALLRKYFAIYDNWDNTYNPDELLNRQIFPPGASLKWGIKGFNTIHAKGFSKKHERQNMGMLVINRYPGGNRTTNIGNMLNMLGHLSGQGSQLGCPYALTTTIHFPDQDTKRAKFRSNQLITEKQTKSQSMLQWSERLKRKKQGFAQMAKILSVDGGNVVETSTTLTLFSPSRNILNKALSKFETYYQTLGFVMRRETYIPAVTFFNNLPMNASAETIKQTHRFKTMMASHAAHLLPILDEYKGIHHMNDPKFPNEMLLNTRLGRMFSYSLFSLHNNNYNWTMIAGAGSGKSFFTQRLTQDHLSLGTKIWTIDTGSSYLAAARASGAQIIDFHMDSKVCLNPFTKIVDLDEEMPLLLPIFEKMAKPTEGFSDFERALMEDCIKAVFRSYKNSATVDEVVDFLNNQSGDDERADTQRKLGLLLAKFSSTGSLKDWFIGDNNFEAEADWTVLELSGLITNKHLCDVVLMMISTTITQEMFTKRDGRRKMLIIEEGGDRITDPIFAEFTAKLYAKVRKEDASVGIVTQSFNQIHATPFGKTIMDNAWTQFYMQQSPESIQAAIDNHWIEGGEYLKHLLRECHTEKGRFSEVVIRSGQSAGIARLIETPFNRVLFSTEGDFFRTLQHEVRQGHQINDLVMEEARRRFPDEC